MSVSRRRRRVGGRVIVAQTYTCHVRDHANIARAVPTGLRRKSDAQAFESRLRDLIEERKSGVALTERTSLWLDALPPKTTANFALWGLIRRSRASAAQPLDAHLSDWIDSLRSSDLRDRQPEDVERRVRRVVDALGWRTWIDVEAAHLERWLEQRRQEGMSKRTSNHYLQSCKQFARWMTNEGRVSASPLARLKPLSVRSGDLRRVRRPLSRDELQRLLRAAEAAPPRLGLTGPQRCTVYWCAAETGLRRSGMERLLVRHVDIVGKVLMLRLPDDDQKARKHRHPAIVQSPGLVSRLHAEMAMKTRDAPLMTVPSKDYSARILREDLERAGVPQTTEDGVVDFHALRHTRSALLRAAGCPDRVVAALQGQTSATVAAAYGAPLPDDLIEWARRIEPLAV